MAADRFRIVEIDSNTGQPSLILNLEDYTGTSGRYYKERDTFAYTPPTAQAPTVAQGGWRGGQRAVSVTHDNGTLAATFRVAADPSSNPTPDKSIAAANDLVRTIDEVAFRPNRYVEWRPVGATKSSFFEIRGPGTWAPTWSARRFESIQSFTITVSYPVAPYALDLPMRFIDPVGIDSYAREWSQMVGSAPTVINYRLTPAAGDSRFINTRHVYASSERVAVRFQLPTVPATAQWIGVIFRLSVADSNVYLAGRIRANTTPQIDLVKGNTGGTQTALGTPVSVALTAAERNWLSARIEGNVVVVEYFKNADDFASIDSMAPTNTFTYTLTGGDITNFGADSNGIPVAAGRVGLYFEDADATSGNRPFVYGGTGDNLGGFWVEPAYFSSRAVPVNLNVWNVPGDLPPQVDVELTDTAALDRSWMALSWNSLILNNPAEVPTPFGLRDSDGLVATAGSWANVASAGALGGNVRRLTTSSAGGVATITDQVVPISGLTGGIDPDPFSEQTMITVFAFLSVSAFSNPNLRCTLRARAASSSSAGVRYAVEWGDAGKSIPVPNAGRRLLYRLGTLPIDVLNPSAYYTIQIDFSWSAGGTTNGTIDIDWLWYAPTSRLAQNRTGIALDSSYPKFFPAASATKRVYHDLTTQIEVPNALLTNPVMLVTDAGLGGSFIEPDVTRTGTQGRTPGLVGSRKGFSLTVASGRNVPDNPDVTNTLNESFTLNTKMRVSAWPRYRFAAYG